MNIEQLWNRSTNLVAASIVALAGFAFAPEMIFETEIPYKIDDGLIFLLGIFAIFWYRRGVNRFSHSVMPVVLLWLCLLVKIGAVFIEFADPEDIGDDFGALVLFLLAAIFVTWLYNRKAPAA